MRQPCVSASPSRPCCLYPLEYTKWGQHDSRDVLALHQFLHDVMNLREQTRPLSGLWQVAMNAGWMVPHERICWLSERPSILSVDDNGRLHAASGPALRYPDGWKSLFLEGRARAPVGDRASGDHHRTEHRARTQCPCQALHDRHHDSGEIRGKWSPDESSNRCDRHLVAPGMERFSGLGSRGGRERLTEPDGTYRHYFLQVPPDMRTPTEAVAWTYGLSPERYAELVQRTLIVSALRSGPLLWPRQLEFVMQGFAPWRIVFRYPPSVRTILVSCAGVWQR